MGKILFVYHNELEEGYMPASLAVLGGVMKRDGIETRLFDTSFLKDMHSDLPENDRQARERTGQEKRVPGYNPERREVDLTQKFMDCVRDFKPDLIAATSTSYEFGSLIKFITPAKREFNVPVIVGGSHATMAPEDVISYDGVDIVCRGEGEIAFSELVRRIKQGKEYSNIPNLWVRGSNGKVIRNPVGPLIDMDDLPDPDWDLFDSRHRIRPFQGELKNYGFFCFVRKGQITNFE